MNIRKISTWRLNTRNLIPFLGLIVTVLFFGVSLGEKFLSLSNFSLIINQSIVYIIIGLGMTFVVAHGNIDFGVGGILGAAVACSMVSGGIVYENLKSGLAAGLVVLISGIVTSVFLCGITAFFHVKLKVPGFVASLALMFLGRGICQVVSVSCGISQATYLSNLNRMIFHLFILVIIVVICTFLFHYTKVGKYNRAMGSNITASGLSGVETGKYKYFAYLIMGCTVGLAAFVYLVRVGSASASTGSSYEVEILISLVLGGLPLTGGSNVKIYSIIIGTLIFMMLKNGLTIMGVSAEYTNLIRGLIFLAVTLFSYDRKASQFVT